MPAQAPKPRLRLVGNDPLPIRHVPQPNIAREIAKENQSAAHNASLDPTDPRWVLAVAAYSKLEGTTLTPERRAQIIRTARVLGIRPFDANVIIALAQDRARRGEDIQSAASTIRTMMLPKSSSEQRNWAWLWISAATVAAALVALLARWILRG